MVRYGVTAWKPAGIALTFRGAGRLRRFPFPPALLFFAFAIVPVLLRRLELELLHQLAHRPSRLLEGGVLLRGQLDLDDLLDPGPAELNRDTDVESLHAVGAVHVRGARHDLLLVL